MAHSFEVDIAVKYGVNAAILLNNLYFWCQKNKANKHNFYDGSYWTYNSRSAFTEIFPYLSERQIKTALDKLIEDGVIKTGCYNKDARDRSLWYALTEKGWCIMQKCSVQNAEMSNANGENVRPLPDTKTPDGKPDGKPDNTSPADDGENNGFAEFWKLYPRKIAKTAAQKAWRSLRLGDSARGQVLADLRRRLAGEWAKKDKQYIPHPTTYLHQRRWEDEVEDTVQDTVQDDTVGPFGAWRV